MLNLMKYEWRKGLFSKIVLLIVTAIAEIIYLIGVFTKIEQWFAVGIFFLSMCAFVGIVLIGIESLLTFSKDLNTKQSYMLFLTPHNSYEILGAKLLMNGCSILIAGAFFALVAIIDIAVAITWIGSIRDLLELLQAFTRIEIKWDETTQFALMFLAASLMEWLSVIAVGDFAIVLSATFMAGKKGSKFVSFLIFSAISSAINTLLMLIPETLGFMTRGWTMIACSLVITILFYALTGWIMEKKLSV